MMKPEQRINPEIERWVAHAFLLEEPLGWVEEFDQALKVWNLEICERVLAQARAEANGWMEWVQ